MRKIVSELITNVTNIRRMILDLLLLLYFNVLFYIFTDKRN